MKQKKISKKLVLNKKSISNLNHREMSVEKGGTGDTYRCTGGTCTILFICKLTFGMCGTLKCPPGPQG